MNGEFPLYCLSQVHYQVETIRYLQCLRCSAASSLGIQAVTVPAHHSHLRVFCQPLAECYR